MIIKAEIEDISVELYGLLNELFRELCEEKEIDIDEYNQTWNISIELEQEDTTNYKGGSRNTKSI